MNEGIPQLSKKEGNSDRITMNERETVAFLEQQSIERLPLSEWKPGEPILYVLEDKIRSGYGPLKIMGKLPEEEKPSLVRVDSPTFITEDPANEINETDDYRVGNKDGGSDRLLCYRPRN